MLIEILVALAIIGLIAGAVGVKVFHAWMDSQKKAARLLVANVAHAAFEARLGRGGACPGSLAELAAEQRISASQTKDPWGHDLGYSCPGEHEADGVDVWSLGSDGKPSPDDIVSWELPPAASAPAAPVPPPMPGAR